VDEQICQNPIKHNSASIFKAEASIEPRSPKKDSEASFQIEETKDHEGNFSREVDLMMENMSVYVNLEKKKSKSNKSSSHKDTVTEISEELNLYNISLNGNKLTSEKLRKIVSGRHRSLD
jgi:hypothetical protein